MCSDDIGQSLPRKEPRQIKNVFFLAKQTYSPIIARVSPIGLVQNLFVGEDLTVVDPSVTRGPHLQPTRTQLRDVNKRRGGVNLSVANSA